MDKKTKQVLQEKQTYIPIEVDVMECKIENCYASGTQAQFEEYGYEELKVLTL